MKKTDRTTTNKRIQKKLFAEHGMTMAEMLITVAIIIILAAVAFISVISYQRSLAQKERDEIAKEIFIAAQNHLAMANSVGYFDDGTSINFGSPENISGFTNTDKGDKGVYYYIVNNGNEFTQQKMKLIDYMLPFGSVDETVRMGSSYVIRYQPKTATVLDVFYCSTSGSPERFNHELTQGEYSDLVTKYRDTGSGSSFESKKDLRRRYKNGEGEAVLGWYGSAEAAGLPVTKLKKPTIKVVNADRLYVEIYDPSFTDPYGNFKLILTGMQSGAKKGIELESSSRVDASQMDQTGVNKCVVVLDDITKKGLHFANIVADKSAIYKNDFIAGEDIKIEAVAYSKTALVRIEYSESEVENSLYQSIAVPKKITTDENDPKPKIAYISSIRHLENLGDAISHTGFASSNNEQKINVIAAYQTDNLDWDKFKTNTQGTEVFAYNGSQGAGGYYPVTHNGKIIYDGLKHYIRNVKINFSGNTGLFGTAGSQSIIKNLRLTDFDVTGTGYTGALVGRLNYSTVSNVVAYDDKNSKDKKTIRVKSTESSAGGLVGSMNYGTIRYSAAAMIVQGNTSAGGLLGEVDNTQQGATAKNSIVQSYSGGHTDNGEYYLDGDSDDLLKNVVATGSGSFAGGLVGKAGDAEISNCYSTCSVSVPKAEDGSGKAGGLVGNANGKIDNCYCTGFIDSRDYNDAFIGSGNPSFSGNSYYYEAVNEYKQPGAKDTFYKEPGPDSVKESIKPLDEYEKGEGKKKTYETFVSEPDDWNDSKPYDSVLESYYKSGGKTLYNLMTVTQLERGGNKARITSSVTNHYKYFVNTHYGDWPAPEIFIINN